jgi:hypothetical protein
VERRTLRRWIAAIVVTLAVASIALVLARRGAGVAHPLGIGDARAPKDTRIRVQVLNATKTRGLARRAAMHLRDRGFDVVETGTDQLSLDSTLVLDRSGHPEWATLVARALGGARVDARPDSSRYLDVTVLLGASWRPPAEPFYP